MSVFTETADSTDVPEPAWAVGKTMAELGKILSVAQIHVASHHKRYDDDRLVDLMGAMVLAYLESHPPPAASVWRRQIVADLVAAPYKEGCCEWRG
jgi:hypothetical protein